MNNDVVNNGLKSGTSAVLGMLSGSLLLENMKMEKQRTGLSYKTIFYNFKKTGLRGIYSGLYPWGIMSGYAKGFGVGASSHLFNNLYPNNKFKKPLVGLSVGMSEAFLVSPLLLLRNKTNKAIIDGNFTSSVSLVKDHIKQNGILSLWKGTAIFAVRRSLDWASRFYFIQKGEDFAKKINKNSPVMNTSITFFASASTVLITTPIDRILPKIYTDKKNFSTIIKEIKSEGIKSIYCGTTARALNTGLVTCWLLLFPKIIDLIIQ
jgi:hypothetical protein